MHYAVPRFTSINNKKLAKRRKELRSQAIAPEAVLWTFLQKRQLLGKRFRRQQSIGPYVVDFYCRECRVIVELDGGQRHYEPLAEEYESAHTRYLEQEFGMKIVRFENKVLYDEALRERGAT